MYKTTILIIAALTLRNPLLFCQPSLQSDTTIYIEQAQYLEGNLKKQLAENLYYPKAAVEKDIQGDVIISLIISKHGTIDSMSIVSSPDVSLSTSAIISFDDLSGKWSPCKVDGIPIDKEYLCVFRYRMFKDSHPPDYAQKANKLVQKLKYEKALKQYDRAIQDNPYKYELFESRARLKEILEDVDGARLDDERSKSIQNGIMSVNDIYALGVTWSH